MTNDERTERQPIRVWNKRGEKTYIAALSTEMNVYRDERSKVIFPLTDDHNTSDTPLMWSLPLQSGRLGTDQSFATFKVTKKRRVEKLKGQCES